MKAAGVQRGGGATPPSTRSPHGSGLTRPLLLRVGSWHRIRGGAFPATRNCHLSLSGWKRSVVWRWCACRCRVSVHGVHSGAPPLPATWHIVAHCTGLPLAARDLCPPCNVPRGAGALRAPLPPALPLRSVRSAPVCVPGSLTALVAPPCRPGPRNPPSSRALPQPPRHHATLQSCRPAAGSRLCHLSPSRLIQRQWRFFWGPEVLRAGSQGAPLQTHEGGRHRQQR